MNKAVTETDLIHLRQIRRSVQKVLKKAGLLSGHKKGLCFDIAPQIHEGARLFLDNRVIIKTLEVNPANRPDYVGDICAKNKNFVNHIFI